MTNLIFTIIVRSNNVSMFEIALNNLLYSQVQIDVYVLPSTSMNSE